MNEDLQKRVTELERRMDTLNQSSTIPLEVDQSLMGRNFIKAVNEGNPTLITGPFTVTIASPGVFTASSHRLQIDDRVVFVTDGALPTGLVAGTEYFVISAGFTASVFQVSLTSGGAAVNTSGSQSGAHTFFGVSGSFMAGPLSFAKLIDFDGGYWYIPLYTIGDQP